MNTHETKRNLGKMLSQIFKAKETPQPIYAISASLPQRTMEVLEGYQYEELIQQDILHALQVLKEHNIPQPLYVILLGPAVREELRTTQEDPTDPSDIDIVVILGDEDMRQLDEQQRVNKTLSWSQPSSGIKHFILKPQSVTDVLAPTEATIYSKTGIEQQLNSGMSDLPTVFLQSAMREGIVYQ